jgi:hypothetical protein
MSCVRASVGRVNGVGFGVAGTEIAGASPVLHLVSWFRSHR